MRRNNKGEITTKILKGECIRIKNVSSGQKFHIQNKYVKIWEHNGFRNTDAKN